MSRISLAEALGPALGLADVNVIIGRGPIASPQAYNGLMVPIVTVDQILTEIFL